jgi:hypothetical protein
MKYRPPWDGICTTVLPWSWPTPTAGAPGRGGSAESGISASRQHHAAALLPERQVRLRLAQQQHAVSSDSEQRATRPGMPGLRTP